jgi:hypothetical protein
MPTTPIQPHRPSPWSRRLSRAVLAASLGVVAAFGIACEDDTGGPSQLKPGIKTDLATIDFGDVQVGTSKTLSLTVENTGEVALEFSAAQGSDWDDVFTFSVEKTIVPTAQKTFVQVTYSPEAVGPNESTLRVIPKITSLPPINITIRGRGATAEITTDPGRLEFGNVVVLSRKTLSLSVVNTSALEADVELKKVTNVKDCASAQPDPSTFCIAATTKPVGADGRFKLAPMERATFDVSFEPTVAGTRERGVVSFQGCASCAAINVALDGLGIESGFRCAPSPLDFGTINPQSCGTRKVTCENIANEDVTLVSWGTSTQPATSPDFTIAELTEALLLTTGDKVDIDVTYCPTDLGNDEGALEIETGNPDPRRRFVQVRLQGNGGGPDIEVTPSTINFGQVSLLAPARRNILIENTGFAPLVLSELLPDADGTMSFTSPTALPGPIAPGSSAVVVVEFQPSREGRLTSRFVIKSNDADEAEKVVTLIGEGVNLPPCQFEVIPQTLGFGVVERGRTVSRAFEIRNLGTERCLVTGLRMSRPTPEFSLPDGELTSTFIAPGAALAIRVAYSPTAAATHNGEVEFSISSPTTPFNTVQLTGTGADATLLITPNDLDFGTIGLNCAARARTVTIYNTGSTPAQITSIALASPGNPAFTVRNLPNPLPGGALTIPPGQSTQFDVGFRANTSTTTSFAAAVEIVGRYNNQPVTYIVSLNGRAAPDARQVDLFDQLGRPKADILWVIDDSCSMFEEQTSLGQNISGFLQFAQAQQIDYQLGVTTTDVEGGADGRLEPVMGNPADRIVTPQTQPSPEAVFVSNANRGTNGSGNEQGLQAAYLALSNPLIFGHNAGFIRPDAVLSVIIVSDEEDYSPGAVDFFANFFLSIKGFRNTNQFSLSAIVGDNPSGCNGPGGNADNGSRYIDAATRTLGVIQSICTSDWSRALEDLSTTAFGFKSRFILSNQPVIQSLAVFVDGVRIDARTMSGTNNWQYDVSTNSVNFTPFATPEPGANIRVEYAVECLP